MALPLGKTRFCLKREVIFGKQNLNLRWVMERKRSFLNNPEGILLIGNVNEECSDTCIYRDEDSLCNH